MADMKVCLGRLKLKNPVLLASGTCGYGRELAKFYDLGSLGGIMFKGTTLTPRAGNPTPRIAEVPSGLLNCVGMQNPGVEYVIHNELPFLNHYNLVVFANIGGNTLEEYCQTVTKLTKAGGIQGFEINISCPNVHEGGIGFGTMPEVAAEITRAVKNCTDLPVFMKLSPNVRNIGEIAVAVAAAGADGITMINTLIGMKIDIEKAAPLLGNTVGGVSGPAIMPVAVRMIYEVCQKVRIPVIGMGGIRSGKDAIEFMMAGASAVAIGSANLIHPYAALNVISEMEQWLDEHGYASVRDIIGLAQKHIS